VKLVSHIKGEKNRLRVVKKRALRKLLGLKGDEIKGGYGKLHEELCN
jgi:hypothetical protein